MLVEMQRQKNMRDLPSANFGPHLFGLGAWTAHLHFACDLVASLKPRVFVELGTDRGESYFAFCQSVAENETDTRCYAIDTWRGDEHAGAYDETTFAEVAAHNSAHYSNFSALLRKDFDAALAQFEPESIDLLHLDGLHTEDAVRHDLAGWLPKLAPGGILLMHDVAVRARDFGVWKVWEELRAQGCAFTFSDAPGLGVWQKPPATNLSAPLETLFAGSEPERESLKQYYRERTDALQQEIWQAWQDGSIRQTAIAQQTTLQLFHSRDGSHSEENSVTARIGHEAWKDVTLRLPPGVGAAPLRLDYFSALTVIDLSLLRLSANGEVIFHAENAAEFDRIRIAGDAKRLAHPNYLRVRVTGMDPQLYLPALSTPPEATLSLALRVFVHTQTPPH